MPLNILLVLLVLALNEFQITLDEDDEDLPSFLSQFWINFAYSLKLLRCA